MKKLLFILLLAPLFSFSQIEVSAGFDPKMAVKGAYEYDTSPSLDATLFVAYRTGKFARVGVVSEFAQLNPNYLGLGLRADFVGDFTDKVGLYLGYEIGGNTRFKSEWYLTEAIHYGLEIGGKLRFFIGGSVRTRNDFSHEKWKPNNFVNNGIIGVRYKK